MRRVLHRGTMNGLQQLAGLAVVLGLAGSSSSQDPGPGQPVFRTPVRLQADGKPIDIGRLSKFAHAGPAVADVDGDGDRDLVVGDFPGNFWLFENKGTDKQPVYAAKGQLQAGGAPAKTPVY